MIWYREYTETVIYGWYGLFKFSSISIHAILSHLLNLMHFQRENGLNKKRSWYFRWMKIQRWKLMTLEIRWNCDVLVSSDLNTALIWWQINAFFIFSVTTLSERFATNQYLLSTNYVSRTVLTGLHNFCLTEFGRVGQGNRKSSSRLHGKFKHGSHIRLHVPSHNRILKAVGFQTWATFNCSGSVLWNGVMFRWRKANRISAKVDGISFFKPSMQTPATR